MCSGVWHRVALFSCPSLFRPVRGVEMIEFCSNRADAQYPALFSHDFACLLRVDLIFVIYQFGLARMQTASRATR